MGKCSVMLEDTEALLTAVGEKAWLTSPMSVSDLEDLLPAAEKIQWAEKVEGATGLEKFEKFKAFLKKRKEDWEALETRERDTNLHLLSQEGSPGDDWG